MKMFFIGLFAFIATTLAQAEVMPPEAPVPGTLNCADSIPDFITAEDCGTNFDGSIYLVKPQIHYSGFVTYAENSQKMMNFICESLEAPKVTSHTAVWATEGDWTMDINGGSFVIQQVYQESSVAILQTIACKK